MRNDILPKKIKEHYEKSINKWRQKYLGEEGYKRWNSLMNPIKLSAIILIILLIILFYIGGISQSLSFTKTPHVLLISGIAICFFFIFWFAIKRDHEFLKQEKNKPLSFEKYCSIQLLLYFTIELKQKKDKIEMLCNMLEKEYEHTYKKPFLLTYIGFVIAIVSIIFNDNLFKFFKLPDSLSIYLALLAIVVVLVMFVSYSIWLFIGSALDYLNKELKHNLKIIVLLRECLFDE